MRSKVHKLDVDKLVLAPADLNNLSNVVKNDVVKEEMYITLRSKILKIKYQVLLT